ncbi:MAG: hypothetical protein DELT_01939 [Desulfovibrio sp.]
MKKAVFSPKALILLFAGGAVLFALSVLLHAYDDTPESRGEKSRPGAFSTSAIGHAGFYDTLRRMNFPVLRSAGNTLGMLDGRGTLIVAEPSLARINDEDGRRLLEAPRLLLVLPKWHGTMDEDRPAWVSSMTPVHSNVARQTLSLVSVRGEVVRTDWPTEWKNNTLGIVPTKPAGVDAVQLIRSRSIKPLVGDADGMLLGEISERGRRIWVLADPDVMANHGIGEGDNAAFMVELIDTLRFWNNKDAGAAIVFDETVHGYRDAEGSVVKLLFRFPFVVVTFLVLASGLLLLFAGVGRFGAPRTPKPPLDFGKSGLIGNSARLLDYAGYHAGTLRRYIVMTVRSTAQALHAPQHLDEKQLAAWLDRIGKARGATIASTAVLQEAARAGGVSGDPEKANLARLFECVRAIHKWKGEILHGSAKNRQHRQ